MSEFLIVVQQMVMFVVYLAVGIIAVKVKLFDQKSLNVLSKLIMKITLPIMIFMNTLNGATRQQFMETLPILVLTAIMYFTLYFLCLLMKKAFKLTGDTGSVYHACSMFGNIGFMGIPILAALFPEKGMLYIAMFTVVDQLVLWTVGIQLTTPEDSKQKMQLKDTVLKMINPATVGIVLAVLGIFAGVHMPTLIDTSLTKIGAITTPLAMIYLGGLFCFTDIKYYIKRAEFFATAIVKMVAYPLAFFYVMSLFSVPDDIKVAMAVLSGLPTMSSIAMFAKSQNSEGEYAVGSIFVTTLLSLVTLPLVCYVIG